MTSTVQEGLSSFDWTGKGFICSKILTKSKVRCVFWPGHLARIVLGVVQRRQPSGRRIPLYRLDQIHFRRLKIKVIYTTFPSGPWYVDNAIFNLLKRNSS